MYDLTVIIPTFREEANIKQIIEKVNSVLADYHLKGQILVVDDNSSDNTGEIVRKLILESQNLELIVRKSDKGLSQAVVCGFSWASADNIVVIDADGSHPVKLIPTMYAGLKSGTEVMIGSRYMSGGGIKKWPIQRRVISLGATFLGRLLFPYITDPVSGFFAVKKSVVRNSPLRPRGYKILLEVLGKGKWDTYSEIPYEFVDRAAGTSKLKFQTIIEYAEQVCDIIVFSLGNQRGKVWEECKKIAKFGLVGLLGIFVNMGILYYLKEYQNFPLLLASFFAVELSIINNFVFNEFWTFKNNSNRVFTNLLKFNLVSIGGLLINMAVLSLLTGVGVYYLISNFFGIVLGFSWNFLINRRVTWKKI